MVGINFPESALCSSSVCGNAAIPAMIPATINNTDTIDQITPQHCDDPPYRFANTLASELFTLRKIKSSQISQTLYSDDMTPINSCPRVSQQPTQPPQPGGG